jgi:DNA-damage-inducible protein J
MIMQKEQANYRLDAAAKQKAYEVLHKIGLKPTDAVNMFMHHIAMYGELPFTPSIPNAETLETFRKTDAGQELTRHNTIDDIFATLDE